MRIDEGKLKTQLLTEAQARVHVPLHQPLLDQHARWKPAAVIMAWVSRPEGDHVVLTQRADTLRHHAGQVAFPGGRMDAGENAVQAAQRELHEELLIESTTFESWGFLPSLLTITGYRVYPLVGRLPASYQATPAPSEVAAVFEVPLAHLYEPNNRRSRIVTHGKNEITMYEYQYTQQRIWGATAAMLVELLRRFDLSHSSCL